MVSGVEDNSTRGDWSWQNVDEMSMPTTKLSRGALRLLILGSRLSFDVGVNKCSSRLSFVVGVNK
jgi:hypothetical protein